MNERAHRRRVPVSPVFLAGVLLAACGGGRGEIEGGGPQVVSVAGRALLIGVSEYESKDVRDLKGPANDVELMKNLLVHRFGFEDVRVLEDEEATYNGILTGIQELLAAVTQDEIALIYYSGHGSQVRDLGGDEKDRFDETIVPYDARMRNVPDITDDMLASELAAHETPAVLILDCCHSGSGTRMGIAARGAEVDTRTGVEEIYADQRALVQQRGGGADLGAPPDSELVRTLDHGLPHVLLAAADAQQLAIEADIDGGNRHGIFTYALVQALKKADAGTSIKKLMRGPLTMELLAIQGDLGLDEVPNPQLEGDGELPLFGAAQSALLPFSTAREAGAGRVRVEAAALITQVSPGAVLGLYPEHTQGFEPRDLQAYATVEGRDGGDLLARLAPGQSAPVEGRAVLLQPAPRRPLEILLADEEARTRLGGLADDLAEFATFVTEPPSVGRIVSRGTDDDGVPGWNVSRGDGVPVVFATGDDTEVRGDLRGYFQRTAQVDAFRSLENRASLLGLDIWLEQIAPPPESLRTRGLEFIGLDVLEYHEMRERDRPSRKNCIYMALESQAACYVTVAEVDAAGSVAVKWPLSEEVMEALDRDPEGRMQALEPYRIPKSEKSLLQIQCGKPYGLVTLIAVATTDPELAGELRTILAEHEASGTGNLLPVLDGLRSTLAARGVAGADWDVASVTYKVDPVKE